MRFMLIVKESEAGAQPTKEALDAMGAFNEQMAKAGVMLAGEGLQPSAKGARVSYAGDKRTVTDGPFTEAKELIGGYWLISVSSLDEAVEWARRIPFDEGDVEVRQVAEASDYAEMTPEAVAREEALRDELERKARDSA